MNELKESNEIIELIEFMNLRRRIYILLGRPFYRESSVEYLNELKKYLPIFETMAHESGNKLMSNGVKILSDYFETGATADVMDAHERLFARLFLNVSGTDSKEKNINAHESCYLSASHTIMQDEWESVYKMMCEANVGKDKNFTELEDHITAEFQFMALLSKHAAEALENDELKIFSDKITKSYELLNKHIGKWVPEMCKELAAEASKLSDASKNYFIGIATLTGGFVSYDIAFISNMLEARLE